MRGWFDRVVRGEDKWIESVRACVFNESMVCLPTLAVSSSHPDSVTTIVCSN